MNADDQQAAPSIQAAVDKASASWDKFSKVLSSKATRLAAKRRAQRAAERKAKQQRQAKSKARKRSRKRNRG